MNTKTKWVAAALASVLAVSPVTGCGNKDGQAGGGNEPFTKTTKDSYPLDTDVTLRYWMQLPVQVSAYATSMNDTVLKTYLEEATGIKVNFEHPVAGQESAAFNILQASGDAPDIIEWSWSEYPGGPQGAIDDKFIIPLEDYFSVTPNLKMLYDANPQWKKDLVTSKGHYYQFPFLKDDDTLLTYMTYVVRKDLLDQAGLKTPVTFDDWETMLYKFKEMGVDAPLSVRLNNFYLQYQSPFTARFGIVGGWYHENGKVKFGPYEPAFADYVRMMKKWYDDGILDSQFADITTNRFSSAAVNGEVGAMYLSVGGEFGNLLTALPEGSGIRFTPVTIPVEKEGDTPMWGQKDPPVYDCAAISNDSKHKELAARFLDFGYSEAGNLLYNFGRENESFSYQDSDRGTHIPTFTSLVMDQKQNGGLSVAQGISKYARSYSNGPFAQNIEYLYQYYTRPEQKAAFDVWQSDALKYKLPKNLIFEGDEEKQLKDIMTAVDTYREESLAKFVAGKTDLSGLDDYFAQLKKLGIEDAIAIQQRAYDRYAALAD